MAATDPLGSIFIKNPLLPFKLGFFEMTSSEVLYYRCKKEPSEKHVSIDW